MASNRNRGPHSRAYPTVHTSPPKPTAPDDPPPRLVKIVEMETESFITFGLLFSDGRVSPFDPQQLFGAWNLTSQEQPLPWDTQEGSMEFPDAIGEPPTVKSIPDPSLSSDYFISSSYLDLAEVDTIPIEQDDEQLLDFMGMEQQSPLHGNQALLGASPGMTDESSMELSDADASLSPGLLRPDPASSSIESSPFRGEQVRDKVSCFICGALLKDTKNLNRHRKDFHNEGSHRCSCEGTIKYYSRRYILKERCKNGDLCEGYKDLRRNIPP
ncbi:hypothetical protein BGZ82_002222 [Podila clonocystis]|nr:hypothetical protein BGZ82_002222 [Podila clonocystis]